MKRIILPCLAVLLLLGLTACASAPVSRPQDEPAQEAVSSGQGPEASSQTGDRNPTAAELNRPETTTLTIPLEGQMEDFPATLQIRQGYSIYIPDTGWKLDREEDGEDCWKAVDNDDVELSIRFWSGKGADLNALFEAFEASEEDFTFTVADESLTGTDPEDGETMIVYPCQVPGSEDAYTIALRYPQEAAEGFGARLAVIAATFSLHAA